jgi:hypothetical protein
MATTSATPSPPDSLHADTSSRSGLQTGEEVSFKT